MVRRGRTWTQQDLLTGQMWSVEQERSEGGDFRGFVRSNSRMELPLAVDDWAKRPVCEAWWEGVRS